MFGSDIPVPVVMGRSYKLSVLGASLVNGGCNIALPHEYLEGRVVNAFKFEEANCCKYVKE